MKNTGRNAVFNYLKEFSSAEIKHYESRYYSI